jgi:hypothetical protein
MVVDRTNFPTLRGRSFSLTGQGTFVWPGCPNREVTGLLAQLWVWSNVPKRLRTGGGSVLGRIQTTTSCVSVCAAPVSALDCPRSLDPRLPRRLRVQCHQSGYLSGCRLAAAGLCRGRLFEMDLLALPAVRVALSPYLAWCPLVHAPMRPLWPADVGRSGEDEGEVAHL